MNERFKGIEKKPLYTSVATLVDPRFKHKFFTEHQMTAAKAGVLLAFNTVTQSAMGNSQADQIETSEEVPAKQPRLDTSGSGKSILWDCLDEIVQSTSVANNEQQQAPTGIDSELPKYLAESIINRQADPLDWWRQNMERFPVPLSSCSCSQVLGRTTNKRSIRALVQCSRKSSQ